MASVAFQLKEGVTAHAQSDSLEEAREICADGTYLPNNLRTYLQQCLVDKLCIFIICPRVRFSTSDSCGSIAVGHRNQI